MEIKETVKPAFSVIGKEGFGNTLAGNQWIISLWQDANLHFMEVFDVAKKDELDHLSGFWGAMTDESRSFQPWKDLKEGYYLAGVEAIDDATIPEGWVKWMIPSFKYLFVRVEENYMEVMDYVLNYHLKGHDLQLVGAIQEYLCPEENGQLYLFFPIERMTAK